MSTATEMFGYPSSIIMDPIHEGIPLYTHERTCIDHPLFQRLRWIVQNDVTSFVFPGATHTRFQHSIGAMHVAGRLFQNIVQQHLSEKSQRDQLDLMSQDRGSINYLLYCLRLAALMHDTGHFPFSHQLERQPQFKEIISSSETQESLWKGRSRNEFLKPSSNIHHEHYSLRMALQILQDSDGLPVEATDVLSIMEDSVNAPSPRFAEAATSLCRLLLKDPNSVADLERKGSEFIAVFLRTLISGELDVDKMDYLLRDSFFAGCHYGFYNLSRLISTIRIGFDFRDANNPWIGMAITEKGVKDLEDLCYSRFQLYQQIYSHKTVVGLKWLLQEAISELITYDSGVVAEIRTSVSSYEEFSHFTDTYLWEKMRSFARTNPKSACSQLMLRKKLEHLGTFEDLEASDILNKQQIISEANSKCNVVYFESPIKFSKIGPGFSQIKVLCHDTLTNRRQLESLQGRSSFFKHFGAGVRLIHFFKRPEVISQSL
jgi:HD superfamily phosphohydrolase